MGRLIPTGGSYGGGGTLSWLSMSRLGLSTTGGGRGRDPFLVSVG